MHWMAKFVRSPYHNRNQDVIELLDYIRKYHPECAAPGLRREQVFQKIWPHLPYSDRALRLLMFRLARLAEQFLVMQLLKQKPYHYDRLLITALGERDLYDLFTKRTEALIKELEAQPYRDESFYRKLWELQLNLLSHPETVRLQISAEQLHDVMALLDNYYAVAKLRYSSDLLNRQNILPEHYDILLLEEVQDLSSRADSFRKNKVLQLYGDLLPLLTHPANENLYARLEENFFQNRDLLQVADQRMVLRCLINASSQLYILGKANYLERQFALYELGLKEEVFIEKGKLPESTFLNVVVTATILHKVEWTRAFIDQYQETQSDNTLNFAEAYWYFSKQDFQQSNAFLGRVKEQDIAHQLRKKLLSLRNHYELFCQDPTYYTLFFDESRAFEKFVRRNDQITARRGKGYLNFLTSIRKIGKLKSENRRVQRRQKVGLTEEITGLQPLEARSWLLEKISLL